MKDEKRQQKDGIRRIEIMVLLGESF